MTVNNRRNVLILIRICQLITVLPFTYNFKKNRFQKSQLLYIYNCFTSVSIIVLMNYIQIDFIINNKFFDRELVDYVNLICIHIIKLISTIFALLIAYQKIFQLNKLLIIFNKMLKQFEPNKMGNVCVNEILWQLSVKCCYLSILYDYC